MVEKDGERGLACEEGRGDDDEMDGQVGVSS